ncbi:hypothetical protein LOKO_02480 [Halomonas chromatireducens]|uniref:Uncharacterized protein n=1 Tax=Halomonas chromatireducens TaxID=507626 RepID=A0A0X8HFC0_9GAMM|nr:hypothetical protein LOKO_02480 [Halomonas chromatireducens]
MIRDYEWTVSRADPSDDGGYVLTVDGLSELVSGNDHVDTVSASKPEGAVALYLKGRHADE